MTLRNAAQLALLVLAAQSCWLSRGTGSELCQASFVIKGGINQHAPAGSQLPDTLVVGWYLETPCPAAPDLNVVWEVVSGGGTLSQVQIGNSIPRGMRRWTLGPTPGLQAVRAIETTSSPHDTLFFTATADP